MTVDLAQNELEYLIGLISQDSCNKQRATGEPTPFEAGVMRKIYDVRQKMMQEKQAANAITFAEALERLPARLRDGVDSPKTIADLMSAAVRYLDEIGARLEAGEKELGVDISEVASFLDWLKFDGAFVPGKFDRSFYCSEDPKQ